jgi:hypothetical protein
MAEETTGVPVVNNTNGQPQIVYQNPPQSHPHWFVLLLACAATAGVVMYLNKADNDAYRKALEETVTAKMQKFGDTTQNQGNVVNYDDLAKRTASVLGPQMTAEIARTNGTMQSLAMAVGQIQGQLQGLKQLPQGNRADDGSFTTSLEQNRGTNPSLAAVNLTYDAKKPGLTGLTGTWQDYSEVFTAGFGQWKTSGDGLRSAVTLKRDVYKDNARTQKVGPTETINITNADAYFSTDQIEKMSPYPKYGLFIGGAVDSKTGKTNPSFLIDKYFYRDFMLTTGYVNKGYVLGAKWTFGKQ